MCEGYFPLSVAEDAVVSDLDEAFREDVEEEALDEGECRERHLVGTIAMCRVTVVEGDLIPFKADQTVVGDGDTVGICAQVWDDVLWAAEGGFTVDVPLGVVEFGKQRFEGRSVCQLCDFSGEDKIIGTVGVFEEGEELTPEQLGKDLDVDEEGTLGRHPFLTIRRQATAGDDTVKVGMGVESL